jgi:hypothetical protein
MKDRHLGCRHSAARRGGSVAASAGGKLNLSASASSPVQWDVICRSNFSVDFSSSEITALGLSFAND